MPAVEGGRDHTSHVTRRTSHVTRHLLDRHMWVHITKNFKMIRGLALQLYKLSHQLGPRCSSESHSSRHLVFARNSQNANAQCRISKAICEEFAIGMVRKVERPHGNTKRMKGKNNSHTSYAAAAIQTDFHISRRNSWRPLSTHT